jgi:hypothetical protein
LAISHCVDIAISEFHDRLNDTRIFSMNRNRLIPTLAVCALVLALAPRRAEAQAQPFSITGSGMGAHGLPLPGEPARPHWAVGTATGLGACYGRGTVETNSAALQPNGTITGEFGSGSPFVFTGASGDKLVCWYGRTDHGASEPGSFVLTIVGILDDGSLVVEAAWIAQFVAVPGQSTGAFAGVTGSWVMYAYSQPFVLGSNAPVVYSWEGEGTLTFENND